MKIAIVGGGAAGMIAAIAAGNGIPGKDITIFEKNVFMGRKILATGNGRCNLTNVGCRPEDYAAAAEKTAFVERALEAFGREDTVKLFESIGLLLREESGGREYPYDGQAASVRAAMEGRIKSLGIQSVTGTAIRKIEKAKSGFALTSEDGRKIYAEKVILATGGKAGMQYGSTGDGYGFARNFGLDIVSPRPALVQMSVAYPEFSELKGIRAKGRAGFLREGKETVWAEGEIQFTGNALSGICIFDLSRFYVPGTEGLVEVDLFPDFSQGELLVYLKARKETLGERKIEAFLEGMLHPKVVPFYLQRWMAGGSEGTVGVKEGERVTNLEEDQLQKLTEVLKHWQIPVTGTSGWKEAQVTAGGIKLSEVAPRTMEARQVEGLYLAGELLDVDGPCGGWNLQWAWTSGYLAGRAAARQTAVKAEREQRSGK